MKTKRKTRIVIVVLIAAIIIGGIIIFTLNAPPKNIFEEMYYGEIELEKLKPPYPLKVDFPHSGNVLELRGHSRHEKTWEDGQMWREYYSDFLVGLSVFGGEVTGGFNVRTPDKTIIYYFLEELSDEFSIYVGFEYCLISNTLEITSLCFYSHRLREEEKGTSITHNIEDVRQELEQYGIDEAKLRGLVDIYIEFVCTSWVDGNEGYTAFSRDNWGEYRVKDNFFSEFK